MEVVNRIDVDSLEVPPRHGTAKVFRTLQKGIQLSRLHDLEFLSGSFVRLVTYGFIHRAAHAVLAMAPIPNGTPGLNYGHISMCFVQTAYFLERAGVTSEAASKIRDLAFNAPGKPYIGGPGLFDGSMLKGLFDQNEHDHSTYAGWAFGDLNILSYMALWGSTNPQWTREKIDAKVDQNIQGLFVLPKWKPWLSKAEALAK
jgi:hypothetical protein